MNVNTSANNSLGVSPFKGKVIRQESTTEVHSGPCDHLTMSPRGVDESAADFNTRYLEFGKDAARAGHDVKLTLSTSGIEHGLSEPDRRDLIDSGVKIVIDPNELRRAKGTEGLQGFVDSGARIERSRSPFGNFEHKKILSLSDGYLLSGSSAGLSSENGGSNGSTSQPGFSDATANKAQQEFLSNWARSGETWNLR